MARSRHRFAHSEGAWHRIRSLGGVTPEPRGIRPRGGRTVSPARTRVIARDGIIAFAYADFRNRLEPAAITATLASLARREVT